MYAADLLATAKFLVLSVVVELMDCYAMLLVRAAVD